MRVQNDVGPAMAEPSVSLPVDLPTMLRQIENAYINAALSQTRCNKKEAAKLLGVQARDPHPRVRLEAVLAAGNIPSAAAAEAVLGALERPTDPLLDFALRRSTVLLKPSWLAGSLAQVLIEDGGDLDAA